MECPVCKTPLARRRLEQVEVDECSKGHGLWFDHGELSTAIDEAEPEARWLDLDVWTDQDSLNVVWSKRKCPKCTKSLALLSYGTTGETIDYCPDEHGIWLDKGEFENIIAAIDKEVYGKSTQAYLEVAVAEAKEIIAGPDGLISEWKDFTSIVKLIQLRILVENPKLTQALVSLQSASPFQ